MSDPQAEYPMSLRIRVNADGARTHIRVDAFRNGEFREFWAVRARTRDLVAAHPSEIVRVVGQAILHSLEQEPLF